MSLVGSKGVRDRAGSVTNLPASHKWGLRKPLQPGSDGVQAELEHLPVSRPAGGAHFRLSLGQRQLKAPSLGGRGPLVRGQFRPLGRFPDRIVLLRFH